MTLKCSGHLNSSSIFYTYKIQFSHSISLKLSFFLLVYLLNYLKYLTLLLIGLQMSLLFWLNLLVILALFYILLPRCLIISPQYLNLASYLFAIATSLIHSKLDYCNSLFLNLPQSQLGHLQLILNSSARAVSKTPKFAHITPNLKFLHWLKIEQRIQ